MQNIYTKYAQIRKNMQKQLQKICRKYTEYAYIFFHINALPLPALLIMMSASALAMVQEMIYGTMLAAYLIIG